MLSNVRFTEQYLDWVSTPPDRSPEAFQRYLNVIEAAQMVRHCAVKDMGDVIITIATVDKLLEGYVES